MRLVATLLAAAALGLLVAPLDAAAIPAFARKYRQSCTTCHAPFPRLKPYGEEFAARGFRMEPGAEPARATLDVGDDLLALPRDFPLAVRFDGHAEFASERMPRLDLQTPTVVKALTGGPIGERISYYAYFIIENGGEAMGLEDAWVQFSDVLGAPLDVVVGQFQICDPIVKRELRLLRSDYDILKARPGGSSSNLTYDRGLILVWHPEAPFEAIGMVTNGNGIGPAAGSFDDDRYKVYSLRLAGEIGPVRLGAFGSFGKEGQAGVVNDTAWIGPDVLVELGEDVTLAGQWLRRQDSNAAFDPASPGRTVTQGGWAEVVWLPQGPNGRLALSALYSRVTSDDAAVRAEAGTVGVSWLAARNVRLVAEARYDRQIEETRASVGTVLAF